MARKESEWSQRCLHACSDFVAAVGYDICHHTRRLSNAPICMYVRMYVRIYVCIYVCVYVYVYICARTHTHTHTHTHASAKVRTWNARVLKLVVLQREDNG